MTCAGKMSHNEEYVNMKLLLKFSISKASKWNVVCWNLAIYRPGSFVLLFTRARIKKLDFYQSGVINLDVYLQRGLSKLHNEAKLYTKGFPGQPKENSQFQRRGGHICYKTLI